VKNRVPYKIGYTRSLSALDVVPSSIYTRGYVSGGVHPWVRVEPHTSKLSGLRRSTPSLKPVCLTERHGAPRAFRGRKCRED